MTVEKVPTPSRNSGKDKPDIQLYKRTTYKSSSDLSGELFAFPAGSVPFFGKQ
jgi:hypothetical protein